MSKKVKVNLLVAVTYAGIDYAEGIHELSEDAAESIVGKNLGEYLDENVPANDPKNQETEEFEPLSVEETMDRFSNGDASEIVFLSLKYHQPLIAERRRQDQLEAEKRRAEAGAMKRAQELSKTESSKTESSTSNEVTEKTKNAPVEELPADFPFRHAFEKLGFKSVEQVQSKTREELIAMDGIAETSVDKALAYGK